VSNWFAKRSSLALFNCGCAPTGSQSIQKSPWSPPYSACHIILQYPTTLPSPNTEGVRSAICSELILQGTKELT